MLVQRFGRDSVKRVDERNRVVKKQVDMCKEKAETNEKMLCNSFKDLDHAKYEYDCDKNVQSVCEIIAKEEHVVGKDENEIQMEHNPSNSI